MSDQKQEKKQQQDSAQTSDSQEQGSNQPQQGTSQNQAQTSSQQGKSSTGLEENAAGALAYVLSFISGVVFLIIEEDSEFVRFHAMQSTITFGGLFVLQFIVGLVPIIGWIISIFIFPVWLILWIVLMVKSYQGKRFKLPIVGNIAEQQL